MKVFRYAWLKAVEAAGCPERIFHDYRRTTARNLVRVGIPASRGKEFTGHKTESIFDRYAISDSTSMREAAAKYAVQLEAGEPNPPVNLTAKVQPK